MKLRILIILWSFATGAVAQDLKNIYERVFIHPNAQEFVAGETLRFSAYTLSHVSGQLADLSKILYVQLVGEEGPVFEQKLRVVNGQAAGAFFVNSLVPSGRYQLVAYTRWMRNFDHVFQLPVTIINPFETKLDRAADSVLRIMYHLGNDSMLVAGIENQVACYLINGEGHYQGKVLDDGGEVVASFQTPTGTSTDFNIIPEAGTQYRVVLEDEAGNFSFHKFLPVRPTGYRIRWEVGESDLLITALGPEEKLVRLEIVFADQVWRSVEIYPGQTTRIPIHSLPSEFFHLQLIDAEHLVAVSPVMLQNSTYLAFKGLQKQYRPRELNSFEVDLPKGQYSISIHQKSIQPNVKVRATESRFWSALKDPLKRGHFTILGDSSARALSTIRKVMTLPKQVSYLPESRHELLSGTLKDASGQLVADTEIAIAFPGEDPQVKTVFTDPDGRFLFHFRPGMRNSTYHLSVLHDEKTYQFVPDEKFLSEFPVFDYSLPSIDSLWLMEIRDRSINTQIDNAFYIQDTVLSDLSSMPNRQFSQWKFEYRLDDYQRFPELREYFVEYILGVGIRNQAIEIRPEYYRPKFRNQQLILLDGVPVSPSGILSMDPYLIEQVKVITNRLYLGPSAFDGLVMINTYDGDLAGFEPPGVSYPYIGMSPEPRSFQGSVTQGNRPDRRVQLYWNPRLVWDGGKLSVPFGTSDVKGRYEVRVEGFSHDGEALSASQEFEVE